MSKLWQKGSEKSNQLAKWVEGFTVGNDYILDEHLLPFDVISSAAHARALQSAGILTRDEMDQLHAALNKIPDLHATGSFKITQEDEDVHTAIEAYLVEQCGEIGKKIHTGRSRNDQVLTAMRLYEKSALKQVHQQVKELTESFIRFGEVNKWVPMPGYTHTQPAMLSSVALWSGSYAELLLGTLPLLQAVYEVIDYCPLGTAAGYGVNLNIGREVVAEELGFQAPMTVAMTAQSSRGRWEAAIVHQLSILSGILAQLASDLILFSSREFEFFRLREELTTGSSIMPQKRNPDTAEILRARHSQVMADGLLLENLVSKLTSGYHRDLQLTKEPVIRTFGNLKEMLTMTRYLVEGISVDRDRLSSKIYPELMAADKAHNLVMDGIPFRDAYRQVGNDLESLTVGNLEEALKGRSQLGTTGNPGLAILMKRLENSSSLH